MKIYCKFNAQVLAVSSDPSKDGNSVYHHATIFINENGNAEAGTLNVPEEIFNKILPGKTYCFTGCFNDTRTLINNLISHTERKIPKNITKHI